MAYAKNFTHKKVIIKKVMLMSKHILKMLTFIISILFLTKNVYAECSYQERKDLLNYSFLRVVSKAVPTLRALRILDGFLEETQCSGSKFRGLVTILNRRIQPGNFFGRVVQFVSHHSKRRKMAGYERDCEDFPFHCT